MSFEKDIKPFEEVLDLYKQTRTWRGNIEAQRALKEIYLKYIHVKGQKTPCGTCSGSELNRMFNRINLMRDGLIKTPEVKTINLSNDKVTENINLTDATGFSKMSVDELKAECKLKGIKYHHKAGVKKLTELLNG